MKLLDIVNSPWAIQPDKLVEIHGIYASHLRGEKIDIAAIENRLGRPLANAQKGYEIIDGVAVLPIDGVTAKKANMMMMISGGASLQMTGDSLAQAEADPAVHSIIQLIDSPGGTVDGTQTYADQVFAARDTGKPIVTLATGMMMSAAYWFGAAASKVYLAEGTTVVGQIGVVAKHVDTSNAEAKAGVKTTEITAGKYKRVASSYEPLSDAGRQSMQDQVDYTYSLFVANVAKFRGVSEDTVLKDMADGRVFIGQQAVDAGLADGVLPLPDLIAQLNADRAGSARPTPTRAGAAQPTYPMSGITMKTAEQIAAEYPEAATALRAQGATAERERIQGIEAQAIPGHEALVNTLKFDGKSTPGDAAMTMLAAEKKVRESHAAALAADAPQPAMHAAPPAGGGGGGEDKNAPVTYRAVDGFGVDKEQAQVHANAQRYVAQHPGTSYLDAVKAVTQQGA